MLPIFVSLSENDKRLILAFLLVLILVFVLIGYIGMLITRIMRWQGKKLDNIVADVLTTRVITTKKKFFPYARKKNWRKFFKESWIPILIIIISALVLVIRDIVERDFSYNPFNSNENNIVSLYIRNNTNRINSTSSQISLENNVSMKKAFKDCNTMIFLNLRNFIINDGINLIQVSLNILQKHYPYL